MTQFELARKAIESIGWHSFHCRIYATEGGKCSDGWADYDELDLFPSQIRYLIKEQINKDELFEGIQTEEVDVEEIIVAKAVEGAWPDGGPRASVNDVIPDELSSLSEILESLTKGECDADTIDDVREKLRAIKDGNYTFHFTVADADDYYYFDEDAEEKIPLTANEAIGLLYGQYDLDEVFEDICDEALDEDFINDKAEDMDFASEYDQFIYDGECEELDGFLDAWVCIIRKILSGDITEETLDSWMKYFDDSDNYESDICDWYEDRKED